jgi:hypothetical protein
MLTLWVMGWVGWLPAVAFGEVAVFMPLLIAGIFAPSMYAAWRLRAHRAQKVRCDWVQV